MKALLIDPEKKGVNKFYLGEVEKPMIQAGEVLIQVKAVPLSSWEEYIALNDDTELLAEEIKNHQVNLGLEFSGVVESDGKRFKKGDFVIGSINFVKEAKTMSEYISVNEDYLASLPVGLSFTEGAALPVSTETAYKGLIKLAQASNQKEILIIGANGGVGVYAIQFAKAHHAHVIAIGGKSSLDKLKQLGADEAYYYREVSAEDLNRKFDIIFDLASSMKFEDAEKLLKENGVFVNANPQLDGLTPETSTASNPYLFVAHGTSENLEEILSYLEKEQVVPVIETVYPLQNFQQAFTQLIEGTRLGKIVIEF
ncbi:MULTISPECIES: NADP-dependent oxidoreductase [Bacillaceae]|uniref:NADP-dependent oxidoreductase n=1 Tax=Bacillales TaxID=1385 RepID=UPI00077D75FC|nr:NADP-dependent oxidoreductase [Priestia megaterium]MDH2363452.1 NADP-dependent oxidoreductase [Priestia megaterium]